MNRELLETLSQQEGLCVSLYAAMHQAGRDTRENPIRFKNLLQRSKEQLEAHGLSQDETSELLEEAEALLGDHDFWQHQRPGLAVFVAPGFIRRVELPLEPLELATIGRHFYLRPLLRAFQDDARFYLLEVSLNEVRLFEGSRESLRELELAEMGVPTSLEEATRFDVHQSYTYGQDAGPGGGAEQTAPHGAGEGGRKDDILYFFKRLENGVSKRLAGRQEPLVFAGVTYLFPLYREANHYPYLQDEAISGSPESWSDEELHQRAWALIAPKLEAQRERLLERFGSARAQGQGSAQLAAVLPAAASGRVDTLLLRTDAHQWGHFDPATQALEFDDEDSPDNDDLLELAALYTLQHGGSVEVLEHLPEGEDIAALYRY